jgi:membrane associated rhomboid family serine protease
MIPDEHLEFLQAVWTRRPTFTYVFFGLNIAVFVLMALAGGSTNEQTLLAFGVKANGEIARGQWWRFVTPIFIHIGMLHLIFNSYALWIIGPQVEKLYGGARFVILYVLTGAAGVYASYFYHPNTISAGASGAIFGLFGVLLVFGLRYRNSIPPAFKRAVGTGVLPVIVVNLIIGFTIPAIDNSAHIGGLLAGALLAGMVPFQKPGAETSDIFRSLQIILLAFLAVCAYEVAAHYDGPHLSVRNLSRGFTQILSTGSSATESFIDGINTAQTTFEASSREIESGRADSLAKTRDEVSKAIDKLRKAPSLAARADELTADLLKVMQDQYELIQDIERSRTVTFAHSQQLRENNSRYKAVMDSFSKWVDSDGPKYGIRQDGQH